MDIDVRLLRSFVAIFERGSLSRAAHDLACTQAAMSMRLKLLETELGEPLFFRRHRRLEPTFRGTEFHRRALSVLAAYDEMISSARDKVRRGKVRIGAPDDYAYGILPGAIRRARADGMDFEIEIVCDLSANLSAALLRGEIDMALATLAARPVNLLSSVDVPLNWVFEPEHEPRAGQPVGLVAYPEGCLFRRAMTGALDRAAMPWAILAQSRNMAGIVAALRGNVGVSAMAIGTAPGGLREAAATTWLPALAPVPVSLLGPAEFRSPEVRSMIGALGRELERFAGPVLAG